MGLLANRALGRAADFQSARGSPPSRGRVGKAFDVKAPNRMLLPLTARAGSAFKSAASRTPTWPRRACDFVQRAWYKSLRLLTARLLRLVPDERAALQLTDHLTRRQLVDHLPERSLELFARSLGSRPDFVSAFFDELPQDQLAGVLADKPTLVKQMLAVVPAPRLVYHMPTDKAEQFIGNFAVNYPHLIERQLGLAFPRFLHRQETYSQEGEDLVLQRVFDNRPSGFYVDVGAHHPIRFSNTYLLYRRGWRGVNIDATPGSMDEFRRLRAEDINIECLVSADACPRAFYCFNEPALNTSSEQLVREREAQPSGYGVTEMIVLEPRRLADILDEHVPPGTAVDLFNIDVEGNDLDVLMSNDWARYRPAYILAELLDTSFDQVAHDRLGGYLGSLGYRLTCKCFNTALFKAEASPPPQ